MSKSPESGSAQKNKGRPEESSPKDSSQDHTLDADPLLGWFALGKHARLKKPQRPKRRKAVRK